MKTSTVYRSLVTVAPYLHPNVLVKRDGNTCGDLQGRYPNVAAPVCSGSTSICTFDGSLQGCCDDSGVCQFYTTCIGLYAHQTCVGSFCLPCSSEAPYCIKYNFWDAESQKAYDGYSCAQFQATQTIWGIATSVLAPTITSSSSSLAAAAAASSSTSSESTESPVLTRFNLTASASSSFNSSSSVPSSTFTSSDESSTASGSLSTATNAPPPTAAKQVSHTGAIAGGVVGGLVLLALIVVGVCCCKRKPSTSGGRRNVPLIGSRVGEVQQVYNDDEVLRPHPWRGQRDDAS